MALGVAVLAVVVLYFIVHSRLGMALRAIRDEEDGARSLGVSPARHKVVVFVVSSFICGLAGGVYSLFSWARATTPSFSVHT